MARASMVGLGVLLAALVSACGESPALAPGRMAAAPAARTRALASARPTPTQKSQLDGFSREEGRPVTLKKDPFGHGVLAPALDASETARLRLLDADRRAVEENGSRSLPGGMRQRTAAHLHFFHPQQTATPRIVPLYRAQSRELIGFRAEVDLVGNQAEEGHGLYFAYYDPNGRLLAANG